MARLVFVKNPRRVNLYLPADLIDAVKAQAFSEHKSASALVAEAIYDRIPEKTLKALAAQKAPTTKIRQRRKAK